MEKDTSGNIVDIVSEEGEKIVFSDTALEWEQVYAQDGEYLVGFLVSDLDGNMTQSYARVRVE